MGVCQSYFGASTSGQGLTAVQLAACIRAAGKAAVADAKDANTKNYNVTSVVVSHDMESVFRISDRIAMIHEGRIIIEGDRAALESSDLEPVRRFVYSEAM